MRCGSVCNTIFLRGTVSGLDNEQGPTHRLKDRVAIVTGVSRVGGIGFAIARQLAMSGVSVVTTSRTDDGPALLAVVSELRSISSNTTHVACDLSDPESPRTVFDEAIDSFGTVDILVCNHARNSPFHLIDVTAEELDLTFAVNTRSSLLLAKCLAEHHLKASASDGDARIIFFTSGQGMGAMPGDLPYVVSKGAIHQMVSSLSAELRPYGISVNAVNPGPTDTGWADQDIYQSLKERFPVGRWGTPEDAARLVSWLASSESAWITGQVINSDGGFQY